MSNLFTAKRNGRHDFNSTIFRGEDGDSLAKMPLAVVYMRWMKDEGGITFCEKGVEMKVARTLAKGKWFLLRPGAEEKEEGNVLVWAKKESVFRRRFTIIDCTVAEKRRVCLMPVRIGGHDFVVHEADDGGTESDDEKAFVGEDEERLVENFKGRQKSVTGPDKSEDYHNTGKTLATFDRQGKFAKKALEYKIENAGNLSDEAICVCYFLVNLMNKRESEGASG